MAYTERDRVGFARSKVVAAKTVVPITAGVGTALVGASASSASVFAHRPRWGGPCRPTRRVWGWLCSVGCRTSRITVGGWDGRCGRRGRGGADAGAVGADRRWCPRCCPVRGSDGVRRGRFAGGPLVGACGGGVDSEGTRMREGDTVSGRIALVLGNGSGGVGPHVRSLGLGLLRRGYRVVVLGPPEAEREFAFTERGMRFSPVRVGSAPSWSDPAVVVRLRTVLGGADVVHAHGLRAGALCALAGVGPLVVTAYNAPPSSRGPLAAVYPILERIVVARAEVVLGVSGALVRRLREAGARDARMAVVAAPEMGRVLKGRAETRRDLAVSPERPLLLTVARLAEHKGLDVLLEAVPTIADRAPEPVVAIAGDGPLWGELHDVAAEMEEDVRMLGRRRDVADLLAAADVFCLTSRWEGPSLAIMEALRAGLPVVATRVGGIPDLYAGTVMMVPPGDPGAFAAAVGKVLDDPGLAEDMRARSREAARTLPDEQDAVEAACSVYKAVARW